jgi:hypothetical protein
MSCAGGNPDLCAKEEITCPIIIATSISAMKETLTKELTLYWEGNSLPLKKPSTSAEPPFQAGNSVSDWKLSGKRKLYGKRDSVPRRKLCAYEETPCQGGNPLSGRNPAPGRLKCAKRELVPRRERFCQGGNCFAREKILF